MSIQYSKDHEWINAANPDAAIVGITVHAQDALGDGWFFKVRLSDAGQLAGLLDEAAYTAFAQNA